MFHGEVAAENTKLSDVGEVDFGDEELLDDLE